jgi:tetratricopeptide (TPR) repeat protein
MVQTRNGHDPRDPGYGERSQYAAHLDRGWQLLDGGDARAAMTSGQHAREILPDAPDACMLLGAASVALGDFDGALEHYVEAAQLDPDFLQAQLAAAQLLLYDLGDASRALACLDEGDQAQDALPHEHVELDLLRAEGAAALGEFDAAARVLSEGRELDALARVMDTDPFGDDDPQQAQAEALIDLFGGREQFELAEEEMAGEDELAGLLERASGYVLRVAQAWLAIDRPEGALPWARGLAARLRDDADAWHMLAEAEFRAGDPKTSVNAALQGYRLDASAPMPRWAPGSTILREKLSSILAECPDPKVAAAIESSGLVALVHDLPALELVLEGIDPRTPALALNSRLSDDPKAPPMLTGIAIYRRNLLRLCQGPDDFERELRLAVFAELATQLGLDEAERVALGLDLRQRSAVSSRP